MSKRNLIVTALLLVALAVTTQLLKKDKKKRDARIGKPVMNSALIEKIDEVVFSASGKNLHLKKEGDFWGVVEKENFPVDMEKLVKMLTDLSSYKVASVVTKDKASHERFKVTESGTGMGRKILLKAEGKDLLKLLIGKARTKAGGSISDGTYLRIGDADAVYLIKDNFSPETESDSWIRTRLLNVEEESLKQVKMEANGATILLSREKKEDEFSVDGKNEKLKKYVISSITRELKDLSFDKLEKNTETKRNILKLKGTVTAILFDDTQVNFQIFNQQTGKDEFDYFVSFEKNGDSSNWKTLAELSKQWLFKVDSYQAEKFLKKQDEFFETEEK